MDDIPTYAISTPKKPTKVTLCVGEPESRYKTRQLLIQQVGHSKMIRTNLINVCEVAKDMIIPPQYIGAFMAYDRCVKYSYDKKKPEKNRAWISGEHDINVLSDLVHKFILEVLLCRTCGKPELNLLVKGKKVGAKCFACGATNRMKFSSDKFTNYVVQNPPPKRELPGSKKPKTLMQVEEDGKSTPTKSQSSGPVEFQTDTSDAAMKARAAEMVPERLRAMLDNDAETMESDVAKILKKYGSSHERCMKALVRHSKEKKIKKTQLVTIVFRVLFGESKDIAKDAEANDDLLIDLLEGSSAQKAFLRAFEEMVGQKPKLLPKVPHILKSFTDNELIEEEHMLAWAGAPRGTAPATVKFMDKAKPYFKWLEEAEEEDSSEEDGEENPEESGGDKDGGDAPPAGDDDDGDGGDDDLDDLIDGL